MKSRIVKGAATGIALVTVAAVSATAVPQIFSESDTIFARSTQESAPSLTEVPDLPDEATIAKAKDNPAAQEKLRDDLKEILDKSNQRLAEVEGETLTANEKARELGEAAAEARREAETASQQAELAAEQHARDQENAGEAVADMYRNGGLSTEEFLLGDEDALGNNATEEQLATALAGEAGDSEYQKNASEHAEGEAASKDEAAQQAKDKADKAAAEEERKKREREEAEQRRLAALQEQEEARVAAAAALEEAQAAETVEDLEEEVNAERFEQVSGVAAASTQTSPTSTEAVSQAPVTPEPTEEPSASPAPSSTPSEEATSEAPATTPSQTPTATPTPTATATPSATPTPTPTQTATPTPTPTQTATQAPKPTPTQTQPAAPATTGSNMSAAVNWAVNKTNEAGTSYVWGGNGPKGYDCSGFTVAAFAQSGKSLPRTSSAQYGAAKQYVSLSNLQPGDLVYWSNNGSGSGVYHVAIYIGNGQIAHARNPSTGITITGLHYSPYNMLSVGGRY